MRFFSTVVVLGSLLFMGASCGDEKNPGFCAEGDSDPLCNPGPACKSSSDCASTMGKMVCDVGATDTCVQCTQAEAQACTGVTPVCGETKACRACATDADCGLNNACLPTGACVPAAEVAFVVGATGSGNTCTRVAPCGNLDEGLKRNRDYVVVAGAVTDSRETVVNRDVTIIGEAGSSVTRSGNGNLLRIDGAATDATIQGVSFINAQGGGIEVSNFSRLTLVSCVVSGNDGVGITANPGSLSVSRSVISSNKGGGISVSNNGSRFSLSNNVIVYNGKALDPGSSLIGGVAVTPNNNESKLEWNTIAFNQSDGTTFRGGASCNGGSASSVGNVFFHNSEPNGAVLKTDMTTQYNATGSGCTAANNMAVADDVSNLGFKSVVAPYDFRLNAGSVLIDAGGTACTGVDFEGDKRFQGTACDIGADEYLAKP
jgi:Right handed beta helix region